MRGWSAGVAVANDLAPLSQSLFAPAAQYTQLASSIAKCQGTEKPKKESYKMYYLFSGSSKSFILHATDSVDDFLADSKL